MERREYEMTQEQLDELLESCRPVPAIMLHCGPIRTPQQNANDAWERLGRVLGFKHMTVRPSRKGDRFFTAEPTESE